MNLNLIVSTLWLLRQQSTGYIHVCTVSAAVISMQWRRLFNNMLWFLTSVFQIAILQVNKEKLLIDRLSLFMCLCWLEACQKSKSKYKVVFIELIHTRRPNICIYVSFPITCVWVPASIDWNYSSEDIVKMFPKPRKFYLSTFHVNFHLNNNFLKISLRNKVFNTFY